MKATPVNSRHFFRRVIAVGLFACGVIAVVAVTRPLWRPVPVYRGRPVRDWVCDALGVWDGSQKAEKVVATELRERAIPQIIEELNNECPSLPSRMLRDWQRRLPPRLRVLPEEEDPDVNIAAVAYLLRQMGEVARPAIPALARCLERCPMHSGECQDVFDQLINMGPVAEGALPSLRRIASDTNSSFTVEARLAICTIEGPTNALVRVASRKPARADFRVDQMLNEVLLLPPGQATTNANLPLTEREAAAWNLALMRLTNSLAWGTLRTLAEQSPDSTLAEAAQNKLREGAIWTRIGTH